MSSGRLVQKSYSISCTSFDLRVLPKECDYESNNVKRRNSPISMHITTNNIYETMTARLDQLQFLVLICDNIEGSFMRTKINSTQLELDGTTAQQLNHICSLVIQQK